VDSRSIELGPVPRVAVESFGEPGRRTFRIFAETADGSVSLWLEKEQIVGLVAAVEQLLESVPAPSGEEPHAGAGSRFIGDFDVKVASLSVGYEPRRNGFTITGSDFLADLPVESVTMLASRSQLSELLEQAEEIVAAGRPRCVLCGTPLTGEPHFCPPSNGHAHTGLEDVDE